MLIDGFLTIGKCVCGLFRYSGLFVVTASGQNAANK